MNGWIEKMNMKKEKLRNILVVIFIVLVSYKLYTWLLEKDGINQIQEFFK